MADKVQQVRNELNETVNGILHLLHSIDRGNAESSNDKGECRHFVSDPHLWMQAWSNEGETMLVSVESSDKIDNNTL